MLQKTNNGTRVRVDRDFFTEIIFSKKDEKFFQLNTYLLRFSIKYFKSLVLFSLENKA